VNFQPGWIGRRRAAFPDADVRQADAGNGSSGPAVALPRNDSCTTKHALVVNSDARRETTDDLNQATVTDRLRFDRRSTPIRLQSDGAATILAATILRYGLPSLA